MKKQRLISLLLALTMLASSAALLSCSSGTENADDAAAVNTDAPSAGEEVAAETEPQKDSLEARMDVSDELPGKTFDGRTFAIIGDDACTDH